MLPDDDWYKQHDCGTVGLITVSGGWRVARPSAVQILMRSRGDWQLSVPAESGPTATLCSHHTPVLSSQCRSQVLNARYSSGSLCPDVNRNVTRHLSWRPAGLSLILSEMRKLIPHWWPCLTLDSWLRNEKIDSASYTRLVFQLQDVGVTDYKITRRSTLITPPTPCIVSWNTLDWHRTATVKF